MNSTINKPTVRQWKPDYEKGKHFSQLVISSRNSGKSYLCRYLLLYKLRDKFDMFVVFCNNINERNKYCDIFPTPLSFSEYKPELIQELFDNNQKREREGKPKLDILILWDDSVGNKIKNDHQLLQTFATGRHHSISCIFISQSYSLCSPQWRNNADIIMLLKQNSSSARKNIKDNFLYGSMYVDTGENKLYDEIIRTYMSDVGDALVIDYRGSATDNLYRFRAPNNLE